MNTKSETIRDMFNRIAPRYDLLNRALSVRIDQSWRKKAVAYLPSNSPLKILDLCAGTLDLTLEVLKQRPHAEVTALDFSEAMLMAGKPKIPEDKKKQVTLQVGDAMQLPFESESFHGALCGFGIRNVVDNDQALKELFRILKPQGRVIILEFFRPLHWQAKLFHSTYGKWVLPRLGGWISKDPEAYQYLFDSIQRYDSEHEFCQRVSNAGFKLLVSRPLTSHVASIIVGEKI
ncbi:MAG: bifunctional demethylmenaquinone methyltransferase/2-methoxy-6-polyprenyl-1,4-benzoquinol methylase UbiE [Deltaproteobacteria bacterium]|nr:bifunctional demethylmenaquinone methyltransferase/2-methoxy-6-polyprenyl-1,4-benzoquinol methylase UbiE [Deltaproteobacteria bacterium]